MFNKLTFFTLLLCWLILFISIGILLYFKFKDSFITSIKSFKITLPKNYIILILFLVVTILLPLLFLAVYCPPNNWDSMSYHLSRVAHWIQNKNVNFYPTLYVPQLTNNPLGEYLVTNIYLMTGGDYFVNLVQFISMICCVFLSSLLVKEFGINYKGQLLASILTLTIPMGILQSTTTQTDYIAAFFLLSFIYFGIKVLRETDNKKNLLYILFFVVSISLGILTKATLFIWALPFVVYFAVKFILKFKLKIYKIILIASLIFFLINGMHFIRNYQMFDSPIGPKQKDTFGLPYMNQNFSVGNTYSNILRNIGLHLALPCDDYKGFIEKIIRNTKKVAIKTNNGLIIKTAEVFNYCLIHTIYNFKDYNLFVQNTIVFLHQIWGLDINNPNTTWLGNKFEVSFNVGEDYSGNFIMLALFFVSFFLLLFNMKKFDNYKFEVLFLFISIITAFIIFSFLLTWQPWHSRLHLQIFVAMTPFISYVLINFLNKRNFFIIFLAVIIGCSFQAVYLNRNKPIISSDKPILKMTRDQLYFRNRDNYYDMYTKITDLIKERNISNIGLAIRGNSWEYPFWVLLKEKNKNFRMEYIFFNEKLKKTPNYNPNFNFSAIIYNLPEIENLIDNNLITDKLDLVDYKLLILNKEISKF